MGDLGGAAIHMAQKPQYVLMHRDATLPGSPMKPFVIRDGDNLQTIVDRYCAMFPNEAAQFERQAANQRRDLINTSGMSRGKTHMKVGEVPPLVYMAINEVEPGFWDKAGAVEAFFVCCPTLRVAPNRRHSAPRLVGAN